IVQSDYGRTGAHGQVHDLCDLRGVGCGKRTPKDGEVLRKGVDETPVDAAIASNEAVTERTLFFHAEILAVVADEFVELFERAFVEQQFDSLPGAQHARPV